MIKRSWVRKLPSDGRMSRAPVIISTIEWARAVRLLSVWWLLGVAEVGSLFPRFRASIWESCRHKAHRTVTGRAWFAFQKCKKLSFLEHDTVASAECHVKNAKNWGDRSSPKKSALSLRECWPIWCNAPAMWVCSRVSQNVVAWLRAAKH